MSKRLAVGWGVALGVAIMGIATTVVSQESDAKRIVAVKIEGTRTVAEETLLARVQTKPGMPYLAHIVSEDIRRLYALGYFADVQTRLEELPEGLQLVFVVKEKPAIGSIDIQGQRVVPKSRILELLELTVGELFDPRALKSGTETVKAEYRRRGYANAEVVSRLETDEAANAVKVYVVVDEGPRMRIKEVLIEGNRAFSDRRIRKLLKTRRRFWFFPGVYNEQVLEEDVERIRAFYRKHGYQDVQVARKVASDPRGRWLYAHFSITEGLQHRVGAIAVTGTVRFPEREVRQTLTLKPGAVFSSEALQEDLRAIKQYYGDRGYINAEVTPATQLDPATKRVNLTYQITEHEIAYIERIDIEGNLRTRDVVIRRELKVYPGEAFDGKKIRRSIERLYNLGYFEEVTVETEPGSRPNWEHLVVKVKEAKTGSLSFGGGFSSVDRLVGLVELEQRNFDLLNFPTFTGAGQDLKLRAEVGTIRRYFDLSFTEPWIFGRPLSFGVDLYNRTRLRSRSLGLAFEEERRGGGIRLGKELTDTFRADLGYQLFRIEISDVTGEASADLKAEEGRNDVSIGGLSLTWDHRDNRFDPTRGFFVFSSADLAGGLLAGDKEFYRFQGGASWYLPHLDRFVFEARIRSGIVNEYSDTAEVPIFERFFAGGSNTIRGYRERRVGPRDPTSNDPIGGEAMLVGTLEEVMTIVKDERGRPILRGAVFYDAGDVWRRIGDYGESLKSGIGIGARVTTPIGPIRVDVGFPLNRIADEKREPRFHFNISRSF